jgi:hypothetical protein
MTRIIPYKFFIFIDNILILRTWAWNVCRLLGLIADVVAPGAMLSSTTKTIILQHFSDLDES